MTFDVKPVSVMSFFDRAAADEKQSEQAEEELFHTKYYCPPGVPVKLQKETAKTQSAQSLRDFLCAFVPLRF